MNNSESSRTFGDNIDEVSMILSGDLIVTYFSYHRQIISLTSSTGITEITEYTSKNI